MTFHLAQFGFVPVSWLRPQYLLAGIWCLMPLVLFTGVSTFVTQGIVEPWHGHSHVVPKSIRRARYIESVIQGLGGLSLLLLAAALFGFVAFVLGIVGVMLIASTVKTYDRKYLCRGVAVKR